MVLFAVASCRATCPHVLFVCGALAFVLDGAWLQGHTVAGIEVDWSKAYDRVALRLLARAVEIAAAPPSLTRPLLAMYCAPRRLRVAGAVGSRWGPTAGLLPGCAWAVDLLTMLVSQWAAAVTASEEARARVYVDGLAGWAVGAPAAAEAVAVGAAGITERLAAALRLLPSADKCAVFASTQASRRHLRAALAGRGFPVRDMFPDIGGRPGGGAARGGWQGGEGPPG